MFRAETKDGKEVFGYYVRNPQKYGGDHYIMTEVDPFKHCTCNDLCDCLVDGAEGNRGDEIDPSTLAMKIGIQDKNKVDIYGSWSVDGVVSHGGDKVKVPEEWEEYGMAAGEIYEVYFAFGGFRFRPKSNKNARGYWVEDNNVFEIIGRQEKPNED